MEQNYGKFHSLMILLQLNDAYQISSDIKKVYINSYGTTGTTNYGFNISIILNNTKYNIAFNISQNNPEFKIHCIEFRNDGTVNSIWKVEY